MAINMFQYVPMMDIHRHYINIHLNQVAESPIFVPSVIVNDELTFVLYLGLLLYFLTCPSSSIRVTACDPDISNVTLP